MIQSECWIDCQYIGYNEGYPFCTRYDQHLGLGPEPSLIVYRCDGCKLEEAEERLEAMASP